ncbi:MAG: sulfatase-like hydrolase/transferase, partial [Myxococcales bacterium]|nr:sulfatase-like hydrolase/transferase [Myxococcales bacterium]
QPTHATLFTGLEVPEHGAGAGGTLGPRREGLRPMVDGVPTLAEHFREQGFQTVLVSANGLLVPESGLTRGFDVAHVSELSDWRLERLDQEVRETLARLDPAKPLFLVVNVIDAHDPYPAVPASVGWVPRARRPWSPPWNDAGARKRDRLDSMVRKVHDRYDYAVFEADRNLGRVLATLDAGGWRQRPWRLVVTSDHGELLGEHGRFKHGGHDLHEPLLAVPTVYVDSMGGRPSLPDPLAQAAVHHLVRDGTAPVLPLRAARLSSPSVAPGDVCTHSTVAAWEGSRKWICRAGRTVTVDLTDTETVPEPAPDSLMPFAAAVERVAVDDRGRGEDAVRERLEALGYLSEPDTDD